MADAIKKKDGSMVFTNGTFREVLKEYSFYRMSVDPKYRRDVRKARAAKKAARKAREEANGATGRKEPAIIRD